MFPMETGNRLDLSVRSGPFIQSGTVTERSQNQQQQVFHLGQDRYQASLDHRSPAWRQTIGATIALQESSAVVRPSHRVALETYDL